MNLVQSQQAGLLQLSAMLDFPDLEEELLKAWQAFSQQVRKLHTTYKLGQKSPYFWVETTSHGKLKIYIYVDGRIHLGLKVFAYSEQLISIGEIAVAPLLSFHPNVIKNPLALHNSIVKFTQTGTYYSVLMEHPETKELVWLRSSLS